MHSLSPDSAIASLEDSGYSGLASASPVNEPIQSQKANSEQQTTHFGIQLSTSKVGFNQRMADSTKSTPNPIGTAQNITGSVKSATNQAKSDANVKQGANLTTNGANLAKTGANSGSSATNPKFQSIFAPLIGVEGTRRLAEENALLDPLPIEPFTLGPLARKRPQICEQATNYMIKEVELIKTTKNLPSSSSKIHLTEIENLDVEKGSKISKIDNKLSGKENDERVSHSRKSLVKSYDVEVLRRYVFDPRTHTYKMRYVREVKVMADDDEETADDESNRPATIFAPLQTSKSFSDVTSLKPKGENITQNPSLLRYRRPIVSSVPKAITADDRLSERHASEPDLSVEKKSNMIELRNSSKTSFRDTSRTFERNSTFRRPVHTSTSATRKSARQIIAKQQQNQNNKKMTGQAADNKAPTATATGTAVNKPVATANATTAAKPAANSQPSGKRPQIISRNASNKLFKLPIVIQHNAENQPTSLSQNLPYVSKDMLRDLLRPLNAETQRQIPPPPPPPPVAPELELPKVEMKEEKYVTWPAKFAAHTSFRQSFDKQTIPLLSEFLDENDVQKGKNNPNHQPTITKTTIIREKESGRERKDKFANVKRLCYYVIIPLLVLAILVGAIFVIIWYS